MVLLGASLTLRGLRNHAMLAMLIGCGLRRGALLELTMASLQQREEHWVIADLVGKGGHVRTVPGPGWVKASVDALDHCRGDSARSRVPVHQQSRLVWGDGMTPKAMAHVRPVVSSSRAKSSQHIPRSRLRQGDGFRFESESPSHAISPVFSIACSVGCFHCRTPAAEQASGVRTTAKSTTAKST